MGNQKDFLKNLHNLVEETNDD